MSDRFFLDTNVIIYLYSEDEAEKRTSIYEYVNKYCCITSTQALNEAGNVWIKKYKWNNDTIIQYLDGIESICDEIMLIRRKTIDQALKIKSSYGYSYYDCLMISSALESNCKTILTEDMNDGQLIYDTLTITNPFINT
ncbi:MAG: PIN domain-containing protein [Oscillospiraceae bacterium]|nr:PIN domain-containing protein [Oscillospiraceae bacterium]